MEENAPARLKAACYKLGTMRAAATILKTRPEFREIGHSTLIRWINKTTPSPLILRRIALATEILERECARLKRFQKSKNPSKELILKALADVENIKKTLRHLLKVLS